MTALHTHIYILAEPIVEASAKATRRSDIMKRVDEKIKELPGIVKCIVTLKKITVFFIADVTEPSDVDEWMETVMLGVSHWADVSPHIRRVKLIRAMHRASPQELSSSDIRELGVKMMKDVRRLLTHISPSVSFEESMRRALILMSLVTEIQLTHSTS